LDDKIIFTEILRANGVPHPPTVLIVRQGTIYDGEMKLISTPAQLSAAMDREYPMLVMKPAAYGSGGKGILFFTRVANGFVDENGKELAIHLQECVGSDWIVQAYARQVDSLSEFHPWSMNSFRIVTFFHKHTGAEVVWSMLKCGANYAPTDNAHTGGVYVRIDPLNGVLDPIAHDENLRTYYSHPTTRRPFSGVRIADFRRVLDLAVWCGNLFPDIRFAGWDIGLTDNGPVVLEGNSSPGLTIIQRTHGGMARVLLDHLKRSELVSASKTESSARA
jgi:hypothetical protein